jgi:hypothetical protein
LEEESFYNVCKKYPSLERAKSLYLNINKYRVGQKTFFPESIAQTPGAYDSLKLND